MSKFFLDFNFKAPLKQFVLYPSVFGDNPTCSNFTQNSVACRVEEPWMSKQQPLTFSVYSSANCVSGLFFNTGFLALPCCTLLSISATPLRVNTSRPDVCVPFLHYHLQLQFGSPYEDRDDPRCFDPLLSSIYHRVSL